MKIILFGISLILLIFVLNYINYLVKNKYIIECFENSNPNNVDLPLNSNYSCSNICGPNNICSITNQQCTSDIDCSGCQPSQSSKSNTSNIFIPGNNENGILTNGVTPTYSVLTSDIGFNSGLYNNKFNKPPIANFGQNMWMNGYKISNKLFENKYKPKGLNNMPYYPKNYSITGTFIEEGPTASNTYKLSSI
jgi:hypothetical protein